MRDYRKTDRKTRLSIATDNRTSADLLTQLATDEDAEVRQAVASNPNTPQDVLLKLGKEFPEEIVANPIFTISLLENPESQFYRLSLARSSTTSGEILANLAQLPDEEILCAIALNPNTPVATLEQLVQNPPQIYEHSYGDEFDRLFSCIAKNPNTPESLLIQLADRSGGNIQYTIAENPNAPVAILEKLANYSNIAMHQAILRNPNAPTVVLEKLAGEQSKDIRNLVKAHHNASEMVLAIVEFMEDRPGTPVHLLEKFATHSSPQVRQIVAEHPHTPPHILELLSLDFPHQVAENPNVSATALERAVKSLATKWQQDRRHSTHYYYPDQERIKALIELDNITAEALEVLFSMASGHTIHDLTQLATTPPDLLLKLTEYEARSQDEPRWGRLHFNTNTPAQALEIMFSTPHKGQYSKSIEEAIARHPNTSGQFLEKLATYPHLRKAVARNPNTPVRLLEKFAMHPELRTSVGENPNAPSELLRHLANYPKKVEPWIIANNKNTPVDLLLRFANSPNVNVRRGLAGNIAVPISILETLANDRDVYIRTILVANPSVPVSILERLAASPDEKVCISLTRNPKMPAQLLELFVDSPNSHIRTNVAEHPNTSINSLIKLAADPDFWVRKAIVARPNLTRTILEKLIETTCIQSVVRHGGYDERYFLEMIVKHPQTPVRILEMIVIDRPALPQLIHWVHEVAAKYNTTQMSILATLYNDRVKSAARKMLKVRC